VAVIQWTIICCSVSSLPQCQEQSQLCNFIGKLRSFLATILCLNCAAPENYSKSKFWLAGQLYAGESPQAGKFLGFLTRFTGTGELR
jgi:hypothetical protein